MNISQWAKVVVAIALGITAIVSGVKSGSEIIKNLNGWHVLFLTSVFVLAVLALDFCRQWIGRQFSDVKLKITTEVGKEEKNRTAWVQEMQKQNNDLRARIEKMEMWFTTKGVSF